MSTRRSWSVHDRMVAKAKKRATVNALEALREELRWQMNMIGSDLRMHGNMLAEIDERIEPGLDQVQRQQRTTNLVLLLVVATIVLVGFVSILGSR